MTLTIYTSNNCPHCQSLKQYLTDNNHSYEERNVSDKDNRLELMSLGFMSVPVTVHPQTNVAVEGFDVTALEEMILGVE